MLYIIASLFPLAGFLSTPIFPASQFPGTENFTQASPSWIEVPHGDIKIHQDEYTARLENLVRPWLLHFTNEYRKANGLDSLRYDDCLLKAAGYHTTYLLNESQLKQQIKLVHQEEEDSKWFKGKMPSDRATAAGCQKSCGENALYMTMPGMPADEFQKPLLLNEAAKKIARTMVYEKWHQSKLHRENMLNPAYTSFGAAVAIGTANLNDEKNNINETPRLLAFGVQVFAF